MTSIHILSEIIQRMLVSVRTEATCEACGLLAGRDGLITHVFPASNVAENPTTTYEIAPKEIFDGMREMRSAGLELLGIYHSHPNGKNEPSRRDVESAYYPEVAYFIISPVPNAARPVRAFSICEGRVRELEVKVVTTKESDDHSA